MFLFFVFLKDSQSSSTLPKLSICGNLKSRLDLFTWHNITILLQEAKDSQPHTPCTRATLCLYQPALIFTIHFFLYFYNTFCVSGSSSAFFFFLFSSYPFPIEEKKKSYDIVHCPFGLGSKLFLSTFVLVMMVTK